MIQNVFLSPHFDDAIGSCGGTIWRLVSLGHPVRVLTVFGGLECEPLSMPARVLHDEWKLEQPVSSRRLEDVSACGLLGCENGFLEFPDAIYRQGADGRHLYPTFEALRGSIARDDQALPERLASQLLDSLSEKGTVVYCPMAIGCHVDHLLVRDCGRILRASNFTVVFYRDFYYDRTWRGCADVDELEMTCITATLTHEELSKKCAAFSKYQSQISDLFGTQAGMMTYFAETGKDESFLRPRRADAPHLTILRGVLERTDA